MTPLEREIRHRIAVDGPISVADYMTLCLGHPEHGYYMARDPFGAQGDFVTAPEISQMFGELAGLWAAETWLRTGRPDGARLVELGPGRGTLMADALRAARIVPGFREAVGIHLVETSPALRARQETALPDAGATWHADLDEVPEGPTLLLANEFFDALPVRQFVRAGHGWHERMVGLESGRLAFGLSPGPVPRELVPATLRDAAPGAIFELSAEAARLAARIGGRLARAPGAAFLVDYGHAAPGAGDTLQALRGHAYADPLAAPGEADLTAHVDFAALVSAAEAEGAAAYGPVTQRDMLRALGIEARAERLKASADSSQAEALDAALARLISPDSMGTLFKVLVLASPGLVPPPFEAAPTR